MTPEEHDATKEKLRSVVRGMLLHSAASLFRAELQTLPAAARSPRLKAMRDRAEAIQRQALSVVVPGVHPAHSDLAAALYQEVLKEECDSLLHRIES